jgi:hypothetical protein
MRQMAGAMNIRETLSRRGGLLVILSLSLLAHPLLAQTAKPYKRAMLVLTAGAGTALSYPTLRDFWKGGVSGSAGFLFHVSRPVAFGLVFEGTYLPFDTSGFSLTWPGVPVHQTGLALLSLSIQAKWSPLSQYAFSPFFSGYLGGTHTTAASYQRVILGKRNTYYRIRPKNRLLLGLGAGADFSLTAWLWLDLEAKATYSYNDPDLGFAVFGRGGVQIRL